MLTFYNVTRCELHNSVVIESRISFLIWEFVLMIEIFLPFVLQPGFGLDLTYFDIYQKFYLYQQNLVVAVLRK